ncbi:hypothetical protein SDC9_06948 [bioreactor metagenome]|jgi:hypothetical protein|uniref:Uncharacterized protein n=2 Tax=root TaxID=1 RepID=A0A2J1E022_9CHLR|nr:hypothetical protein [Dehalococcoides sp.]PKH47769.1 hypothetical protein CVH13_00246 [Dehalococcoides mccartyi]
MGRLFTKIYKGVIVACLCLASLPPAAVLAVDPAAPTTFTIDDVQVAHNIVETGDSLVSFKYTIAYSSGQPTTPANKLFHFRLMDTDGIIQLGAIEPYAYYNAGYDMGYSAFYFAADDAPEWETALILKMVGNPQYWEIPPEVNYTLTTSDYSQLETKKENQTLMGSWIIEVCRTLEINWVQKLLTETDQGTVFNEYGSAYGKGTIPGLQTMCPKIFSTQTQGLDMTRRVWVMTKLDEWAHQWDGTIIGDILEGLASIFNNVTSWQMITSLICIVMVIGLFIWGRVKYANNHGAMIASSYILAGGTDMGLFNGVLLAMIVTIYAAYASYVLMGRHA